MNILLNLFDLMYLYETGGIDTVAYALMAIVGTGLFIIKMGLSLILGVDGDVDMDVDVDADGLEHGTGFSMFSVLSVIGFFMGAGWAGLAARMEWGLDNAPAAVVAGGFGLVLMLISSLLMFSATKLTQDVTYDLKAAVGKIGTVYMSIPPKGDGAGKIRISVSGRSMIVDAVQTGSEKLEAFKDIEVTEVRDDKTLVVSGQSGGE